MRIFIEPTEPLLFRNGKPFAAGENNFAESIFPPTPETLQGVVRSVIAIHWGQAQNPPISNLSDIFQHEDLNKLVGKRIAERDTYGQFRITGMTLGRRNPETGSIERLFPAPSHIIRVTLKSSSGELYQKIVTIYPRKQKRKTTNMPPECSFLPLPVLHGQKTAGKSEGLSDYWLTPSGLKAVLCGDLPSESKGHLVKSSQIYTHEPRLGIGMDNARGVTKEHYLYQMQMIRVQPDYGFVIDIALGEEQYKDSKIAPFEERQTDASQEMLFLKSGWATIGGEQRAAHFTVLAPEEPDIVRSTPGNLLYFATPAYFKRGWLPEDSTIFPARPITAAINRYQPIGGWYLDPQNAGGGHKAMRRCIPAGSVYFFDQEITLERPLTEYGWQIGYGIAYTGRWN